MSSAQPRRSRPRDRPRRVAAATPAQGIKWPGIDTPQLKHVVVIKANICSDERSQAVTALRKLGGVLAELVLWAGTTADRPAAVSERGTAILGFSARFFRGPLTRTRDTAPALHRYGIEGPVPADLGTMRARGDDSFRELCGDVRLRAKESDLIVVLESSYRHVVSETARRVRELERSVALRTVAECKGALSADSLGCLGARDGISNLQDIARDDPDAYRRHVYVRAGSGEPPVLHGGTYLVFRRYVEHRTRWLSDSLTVLDNAGSPRVGAAARELALGRAQNDNLVVDRETGAHLAPLHDERQGCRAFDESHIRQANPRGRGTTNFGSTVTVNSDARILRRSFPFTDIDPQTGSPRHGLLFMCFHNNITRSGFQFIHNEWLMSRFLGGRDRLLTPESGIIEPIDGCYYFVPPRWEFPGARFFG
jgi:Dyp-type peroxidase family